MISDRIVRMCKDVERLACEFDILTARGHGRTVYAVVMRMRLAAMTAELVTADLVERLQQKAAGGDQKTRARQVNARLSG